VRFDYGFIREEFASLGFTFTRRQLCTVVLSRKSFPGLRSYSLGNLIQHFNIQVQNRHRAMDDVLATVQILGRAIALESGHLKVNRFIREGVTASHLPDEINADYIRNLPDEAGVYYFYNRYGTVIYVGKSISIRKRVMQHFGQMDAKTDKFIARVTRITYEITGSELLALLLESVEIKALQPEINKAQRTREYPWVIFEYYDNKGYLRLDCSKASAAQKQGRKVLHHYASRAASRGGLMRLTEVAELCQGLCGLHTAEAGCFYYQTGACSGACQAVESPESYNARATVAVEWLKKSFDKDFILITAGRNPEEYGLVLVENGQYQGIGFVSEDPKSMDLSVLKDAITRHPVNPECNQIVMTWINQHGAEMMFIND
jgi:DNA polymerase-3 subunit epsilon